MIRTHEHRAAARATLLRMKPVPWLEPTFVRSADKRPGKPWRSGGVHVMPRRADRNVFGFPNPTSLSSNFAMSDAEQVEGTGFQRASTDPRSNRHSRAFLVHG